MIIHDALGGWHPVVGFIASAHLFAEMQHNGLTYAVLGPDSLSGGSAWWADRSDLRITAGSLDFEAQEEEAGLWSLTVRFRIPGTGALERAHTLPQRAALFIVQGDVRQPVCVLIGSPERPLQRAVEIVSQRGDDNYLGAQIVYTGQDQKPYRRALAKHTYGSWQFRGLDASQPVEPQLRPS